MKKGLFFWIALLVSGNALGATDHYVLRDDNHVHHLKITRIGDEVFVTMDVNFQPDASQTDGRPCSADISGEAQMAGNNQIVLKQQADGEAHYCTLKIDLTETGAKVEQSKDCNYFAADNCHFESKEKELVKIR